METERRNHLFFWRYLWQLSMAIPASAKWLLTIYGKQDIIHIFNWGYIPISKSSAFTIRLNVLGIYYFTTFLYLKNEIVVLQQALRDFKEI